jgi:hypothetical protein
LNQGFRQPVEALMHMYAGYQGLDSHVHEPSTGASGQGAGSDGAEQDGGGERGQGDGEGNEAV